MATSKFNIDYASAVNLVVSGTSATVALPPNSQLIGVSVNVPVRFRISPAAQATAILTDPLITPNSEIQILRIEGKDTNISAILDPLTAAVANQAVSCFRVFEA